MENLNLRFCLIALLTLFVNTPSWAKRNVEDELTLPIDAYWDFDQDRTVYLSNPGELVLTIEYWDTFSNPANNSYSLKLHGYSNTSRSVDCTIFNSHLSGASPSDVKRNKWGNNTWCEKYNGPNGVEHIIYLTCNNLWETRCGLFEDGNIWITYGRLTDDGSLKYTKSIRIKGGIETWNKLAQFLRKAHSFNIGKTI